VLVTYFDQFSDYALMLGSADLGLSFHASSSGFDLPMKIVDMFGCGLCVCSIRYACIDELVQVRQNGKINSLFQKKKKKKKKKEKKNGLIFENATELANQLALLFKRSSRSELQRLKKGVTMMRWDESWKPCLKILKSLKVETKI
jgi:beta-1,4-mannosyltransferase